MTSRCRSTILHTIPLLRPGHWLTDRCSYSTGLRTMIIMVSVGIASAAFQIAVYVVHNRRVNDGEQKGSELRAKLYVPWKEDKTQVEPGSLDAQSLTLLRGLGNRLYKWIMGKGSSYTITIYIYSNAPYKLIHASNLLSLPSRSSRHWLPDSCHWPTAPHWSLTPFLQRMSTTKQKHDCF